MAFGNIGRVIAGQALDATKKNVIDALTAEPAKPPEKPLAPESVGGIILGQVQGMQRALRDDQELQVFVTTPSGALRVHEIFVPSVQVLVFAGMDAAQNVTRLVAPADSVQVLCKICKVAPEAKPLRVNVLSPRAKPEGSA
jgi:hypothetical protein